MGNTTIGELMLRFNMFKVHVFSHSLAWLLTAA